MRNPGLLALLAILPAACDDSSPSVGTPLSVPLVTRDGIQAGTVTVSNSTSTLRLDIVAQDGWTLEKVRAAAGTSLAVIPQSKAGQPQPESFPLRSKTESVTSVHFSVPLTVEPGTELLVAVMAEVRDKAKETQQDCGMEPAWGAGTPFPKKPDAMYFAYVVQSNKPHDLSGMYRTQTQSQWGGASSPGNAPAYLMAHYPGAVTIGMGPSSATFTSADAVLAFLPQGGPSGPIGSFVIDPLTLNNSLAGETLALTLTLAFDNADPAFSSGVTPLGSLLVADPGNPCFGRSVNEVLNMANRALGGMADPFGPPADLLMLTVQQINSNFADGLVDQHFLGLP